MNREKVSQILQSHRSELAQKYGVRSLPLFGSVARNEANAASDVDLIVEFDHPVGNFQSAQHAFKTTLRLNPSDVKLRQRLEIVEQIVSIDPALRGLKAKERYERSRKLIETILQSLEQRLISGAIPLFVTESETVHAVRRSLASKKRPHSFGDSIESNLESANNAGRYALRPMDRQKHRTKFSTS